jgi:hypothetical protein
MKNPLELLRVKEQQVLRLKKEIEALKLVSRLLAEEGDRPAELNSESRKVISMP